MPWNVRYFPLPAFVLIWPSPSNFSSSRILCSFFSSISILHPPFRFAYSLGKFFAPAVFNLREREKLSKSENSLFSSLRSFFSSSYRDPGAKIVALVWRIRRGGYLQLLAGFFFFFFPLRRFSWSPELISRDTAICTVARRKWVRFPVNVRLTLNLLANGITQTQLHQPHDVNWHLQFNVCIRANIFRPSFETTTAFSSARNFLAIFQNEISYLVTVSY